MMIKKIVVDANARQVIAPTLSVILTFPLLQKLLSIDTALEIQGRNTLILCQNINALFYDYSVGIPLSKS